MEGIKLFNQFLIKKALIKICWIRYFTSALSLMFLLNLSLNLNLILLFILTWNFSLSD
jgi:hypothetical protein